jgi:putative membrane protein
MTLLWIKALHVFFMVAWMSGLFYLPRLMVYHAQTDIQEVKDQFKIMEKRLWYFVTPFALLTLVFGVWFVTSKWLHIKLILVTVLYAYHGYLFVLVRKFSKDENTHSSRFFRFLNEAPVLIVLAIIVLAIVKYF